MNAYLKEIADTCGISKNLTFHIARHTFATTVPLSNGVPIETVSKMLGLDDFMTEMISLPNELNSIGFNRAVKKASYTEGNLLILRNE